MNTTIIFCWNSIKYVSNFNLLRVFAIFSYVISYSPMLQNCATKLLHMIVFRHLSGFSNFWSQKRLPVVLHFWSRLQHDLLQWHVGNWPELLIQVQLQLPIQWVQPWFLCDFQKAYCRWIVDTNFLLFLLLRYVFLHQFLNLSKRLRLLDF